MQERKIFETGTVICKHPLISFPCYIHRTNPGIADFIFEMDFNYCGLGQNVEHTLVSFLVNVSPILAL